MNDKELIKMIIRSNSEDDPDLCNWLKGQSDMASAWQNCPDAYWMDLLTEYHHNDADPYRYKWESQTASMISIVRSNGSAIRDDLTHMEIALWMKWSYEFWDPEKEDWEEWDNRRDEMLNDVQHIYDHVYRVMDNDPVANEWYRSKLREIWGNPFVEDDSQ